MCMFYWQASFNGSDEAEDEEWLGDDGAAAEAEELGVGVEDTIAEPEGAEPQPRPLDQVEPPPAAAAPVADPPPQALEVDLPWLPFHMPNGKITWYREGNKFEARCKVRSHGRCALTRKARVAGRSTGRPMGLMLAWLQAASSTSTHEAHLALADELESQGHRATRRAARAAVQDDPQAQRLFRKERAVQTDESIEP